MSQFKKLALGLTLISPLVFSADGQVFVRSEPEGAEIFVSVPLGVASKVNNTGKKTPALVDLPAGKQKLILRLAGHNAVTLDVDIDANALGRPEPVKFERQLAAVDVSFLDDGWAVCDKEHNQYFDAAGKPAVTPCTVNLPVGPAEISLVKTGFKEIKQKVNVPADGMALEINARIRKGTAPKVTGPVKPSNPPNNESSKPAAEASPTPDPKRVEKEAPK